MEQIKLNRKWEVLLIHHSHTDIGYTQAQETVELYHINFIKQAIQIAEYLRTKGREKQFVWTCESFWGVDCFLKNVDDNWKKRFKTCVLNGSIEITGNYLNLNELIDYDVLKNYIAKSVNYAKSIGTEVNCAMTADINGYSAGYSDALYENGIKNLFSCIHTHHGMYPLFRKQTPFYWETPKGNKILVWNGEHYHFGNEFGIVKTATGSYINKDELADTFTQDKRYEYGKIRMYRYLKSLEDQDYEYNFVPININGLPTDNASPNLEVVEFINWWNENFGEEVIMKMTTIDNFFKKVKASDVKIPTYSGDWPDWWAFGVGSTPQTIKIYKEVQRLLKTTKLIDNNLEMSDKELVDECEKNMMLYSEHTWGHSASVIYPWNSFVNLLDYKNDGYAIRAHEMAIRNFNKVLEKKGMTTLKANRELKFKIINPYNRKITQCVKLSLDYWEISKKTNVIVDEYGNEYVTQSEQHPRGVYLNFIITLDPKEERKVFVKREDNPINYIKIKNEKCCCQSINDIYLYDDKSEVIKYGHVYENKHVKISWDYDKGIASWFDKENKVELIDQTSKSGAFMPIYELTKAESQTTDAQYKVRQKLGRNMRGTNHKVFYPKIKDISISEVGKVFGKINFDLELEGVSLLKLIFKVYNDINRVDILVIINKNSVWDPESLFIALPFAFNNKKMDLLCDKTGCTIQVKKDQLLGTNCDYYLVQQGVGLKQERYGINIAMPDSSLIYTSPLKFENAKKLYHEKYTNPNNYELYSWVMNNIWETNFKASLGGFIEFNYSISWSNNINNKEDLTDRNYEMNSGFVAYRI